MIEYREMFIEGAKAVMAANGFEFTEAVTTPENAVVVAFAKDGENAFVTASDREIRMNATEQRSRAMVKARTGNAMRCWEYDKERRAAA